MTSNKFAHENKLYVTILAFKDFTSIPAVCITTDGANERAVMVHWNGNLIIVSECDDGLYFFDTAAP